MEVHPSRQEADMARIARWSISLSLAALLLPLVASAQTVREAPPLPGGARIGARAVLLGGRQRVFLYGGANYVAGAPNFGIQEDLWSYDLRTDRWESIPKTEPWPGPRAAHCMATDSSGAGFYLSGGADDFACGSLMQ